MHGAVGDRSESVQSYWDNYGALIFYGINLSALSIVQYVCVYDGQYNIKFYI